MNLKKAVYLKRIISAAAVNALLIYFTVKTLSPKIIFIPFLICGFAVISENILLLFGKTKPAELFNKLFAVGFLLFLFGFISVAVYVSIRDENYSLLLLSIPFLLIGLLFAKRKIFGSKAQKSSGERFLFPVVMSSVLVAAVLISGAIMLFMGIVKRDIVIAFFGTFFVFGALTFILAVLSLKGCFDKCKIDVLRTYIGSFIAVIGAGFVALKFIETYSVSETVKEFGVWILIPILMIVVGIFTVVNCLKDKKK